MQVAAGVFNVAGGFARKPFLEITLEEWEKGYETNRYVPMHSLTTARLESTETLTLTPPSRGAFLFAQSILPLLSSSLSHSPAHPPTLIFTGATASMKGSALFSAFAAGKFAQRALAQSLAREYGPKGVHVAHVIVDGVIDIARTKEWDLGEDAKISPAAIADAYWWLHTQPRTTFTFEIDVRPFVEKW